MIQRMLTKKLPLATDLEKFIYNLHETNLKRFKKGMRLKKPRESRRILYRIEFRCKKRQRIFMAVGAVIGSIGIVGAMYHICKKKK